MQAFSQDPVMQQKANMAMHQAQHMLQVARAQMEALQQVFVVYASAFTE